jgi:hypothetical protein
MLAAYTTVGGDVLWETSVIAAVLAAFCLLSVVIWAGFGTVIGRFLANPRARIAFNWSMAGLLCSPSYRCFRDGRQGDPAGGRRIVFRGGPLTIYDGETRQAIASLGDRIDADAVTDVWEQLSQRDGAARQSGSTAMSRKTICWSETAACARSSTSGLRPSAIPPVIWRLRGRCCEGKAGTRSGPLFRSTGRPGREVAVGHCGRA